MKTPVKAVIFDMDGVLIDSEPLWREAMILGFNAAGIPFTEEDCRLTTGMRLREVVQFWFDKHTIRHLPPQETNSFILDYLVSRIEKEGQEIEGVSPLLNHLKKEGYKIGLATSSDVRFMNTVLDKLGLHAYFDAITSAEHLSYAKPHPEVFLKCAQSLEVKPQHCLVIEDSVNGVIAAKAALMRVVAIPELAYKDKPGFKIADWQTAKLSEVNAILNELR